MTDIVEKLRVWPAGYGEDTLSSTVVGNIMKAAADEIERLRAASEWRDISTAPRDGRNVSVHSHDLGTVTAYWQIRTGKWIVVCSNWEAQPTHWQPLPAPPQRNEVKP